MTDPVPIGAVFGALCAGLAVALAPGRRSGAIERRLGSLLARAGPPVGSLLPYAARRSAALPSVPRPPGGLPDAAHGRL